MRSRQAVASVEVPERSPEVELLPEVPRAPTLRPRTEAALDLDTIFGFINPQMLYVRHMGLKGNFLQLIEDGHPKALELEQLMRELLEECRDQNLARGTT